MDKRLSGCLILLALLCSAGCGNDKVEDTDAGNVSFDISKEDNSQSFDTSLDDVGGIGGDQPMYEIDGQYAYEINPVTLERISGPLDPETHEAVSGAETTDQEGEAVPNNDVTVSIEGNSESDTGTQNPLEVNESTTTEPETALGGNEAGATNSSVVVQGNTDRTEDTGEGNGIIEPSDYNALPNTGMFLEDD